MKPLHPSIKPTHPHDCVAGGCVFVGTTLNDAGDSVDWYVHVSNITNCAVSVLGRIGPEHEYSSWDVDVLRHKYGQISITTDGRYGESQMRLVAREMLRRFEEQ